MNFRIFKCSEKAIFVYVACVLFSAHALGAIAATTLSKGRIEVTLHPLRANTGKVFLSLSNTKEGFLGNNDAYARAQVKVQTQNRSGKLSYFVNHTFTDIPYGKYAIAWFHDVNDDNKMERNWMGIPVEPWGCSNHCAGLFGPRFKRALFSLDSSIIHIDMDGG